MYESTADNPYLADFYRDMPRYALALQLRFLACRVRDTRDMMQRGTSAIQDRTCYEDAEIFAANLHGRGEMDDRDFETYQLERIGLLPFLGLELGTDQAFELQSTFFTEFSVETPFEVVPLYRNDLEEVPGSEPYRRGGYDPRTIIDIARRFRLDGVFVATVTDYQFYKPQRLSVQVDLVASETGVAIWSSSIHHVGPRAPSAR